MIKTSNYVLNVEEDAMIPSSVACGTPSNAFELCNGGQVIIDNFIFAHLYTADIQVDAKAQSDVRAAAYTAIDDKHFELYKKRISNKFFVYNDKYSGVIAAAAADDTALVDLVDDNGNGCCHYYVDDLDRIVCSMKELERGLSGISVLVLYPYSKQLRDAVKQLKSLFPCCIASLDSMQIYINNIVSHCLLCIEKLEGINRTVKVMNVFTDDASVVLYECNICKETSTDERFLKPKECCEFVMCNACCVKLWKTAATHAKCPACRTSFKSR
ncbi:ie0 [Cyclophragma undans nucleopolyhedrovirus]|uniref:Ie0 n=1 Tax=Cyclophragma undans nucleopolyhedrovirus TaxID=1906244 RepID=A0A288Q7Y6_9ABAC|nr:ie0 [Cyclophragma undans nucleopolyhedrovirus]AOT85486.1 ie0 [Cyclophragma undans nucleopolyhedrovirus]